MTTIALTSAGLSIDDHPIAFPTTPQVLAKAFGSQSRTTTTKHSAIYTWDALGVCAYAKPGSGVHSLVVEYRSRTHPFSPTSPFVGQLLYGDEDAQAYHRTHRRERVPLFKGDDSGALVLGGVSMYFSQDRSDCNVIEAIEIKSYEALESPKLDTRKYLHATPVEPVIPFTDFGFKLAVVQELMYTQELLNPMFDLYDFVFWYDGREIDLEAEGYAPIAEVTAWFRELPVPASLAPRLTEIYQDGGNEIYLQLIRFAEGYETYWDIESARDAGLFPNLKEATLCYAKDNVITEFRKLGLDARWL